MFIVRSSIREAYKRSLLWRGTFLAALGIAALLYSALAFTVETLQIWGLPILFLAFGLIAIGLIPYRRVASIENHPYELMADEDSTLYLKRKGRVLVTLSIDKIEKIEFSDDNSVYGIKIWLNNSSSDSQKNFQRWYGCDLFLPFFSERSFTSLEFFLQS